MRRRSFFGARLVLRERNPKTFARRTCNKYLVVGESKKELTK
jgi:hypothetical protein